MSIRSAITKHPSLGKLIDNRDLLLAVLEAEKFRIKASADLVSGERPLPQMTIVPRKCHLVEGARSLLGPL